MEAGYSPKPQLLLCLPWIISLILLLLSSTKAEAAEQALSIAKTGCKDRCGNVSIPFPWGFGPGCFLDHWFEIECRQVASTKLPFLTKLGVEVVKLEAVGAQTDDPVLTEDPKVIVRMQPVNACTSAPSRSLDMTGSPYKYSGELNVFVMWGCSGSAILVDESSTSGTVGCATICLNNDTVAETNKCRGVKCCQSPLVQDLRSYQVDFYREDRKDCLLASLIMRDHLDQYARRLSSPVPPVTAPVALTWSWISNTQPGFNPNTATCQPNELGWGCSCAEFHEGSNPYVYGGCKVPQNCQGCPGSCVDDWSIKTYSCQEKGLQAILNSDAATIVYVVFTITSIAFGPLLLVLGCRSLYRFTKRRRKAEKRVKFFKLMMQKHQTSNNGNGAVESTKLFNHKELDKATEHFNENRVLGKGGQGTVYKGMLTDGRIVAVKKSMQMDESQMERFINEVVILSQTNHRNVVKLLGCCLETEVPLLAYEYISNGTLHQHLHNSSEDVFLSWTTRLKIAAASAGAIAYLHSSSSTPVYHRDIKSANILLDEKYRAKVSDFGCSKTIEIDQTHLTTLVQGTIGYLDPEYFESSIFTEKSDVYSFGVVLLKLLTSKKPIFRNEEMEQKSLVSEFFTQMQQNHGMSNILDTEVVKDAKEEEILVVADLAKRCLNESGRLRPTMREVAMKLGMIMKSATETYAEDDRSSEDKGFDAQFLSRSARVDVSPLYNDVDSLLHDTI